MASVITIQINEITSRTRLLDYAIGKFESLPSRNALKKALKSGRILLNGQLANSGNWVKEGDTILLKEAPLTLGKVFKLDLPVFFEDDDLAIIEKPAGIIVSGNRFKTIQNALPYNLLPSPNQDKLNKAQPVHRLDAQTSGILLVAKTSKAQMVLGQEFEQRNVTKTYHAVVHGHTPKDGEIIQPIEGLEAITKFHQIALFKSGDNRIFSLLMLKPISGRTHQIRIHLSGEGYPIVGDLLYGPQQNAIRQKGLFLAATGIQFNHPKSRDLMEFKVDIPHKFTAFLKRMSPLLL